MRILVTGGAGFIGSNFLTRFVPRFPEHEFVNLDSLTYAANLMSLAPIASAPNYRLVVADIGERTAVDRVIRAVRPDVIVHFAAESHVDRSIRDPGTFLSTNVQGTFHLLEAARALFRNGHGLFHHVSTDEVFGSLDEDGRFTESSPYDPSSPYSASKAASDHLVRAWGRTYGLPIKITNCSNNYGPRQFPEKLVPLMILRCLERRPLPVYGNGLNVRDWLYVEDHCEAIWSVLEHGKLGETYAIGGNEEQRNIDVVERICHAVAHATGGEPSELTDLLTFVPDRPGHDQRYAIDASKIREECGWAPAETFESGLDKTVRWYLGNRDWVERVKSGEYRHWMATHYGAETAEPNVVTRG